MLQGMLVACGLLDASTAPAVAEPSSCAPRAGQGAVDPSEHAGGGGESPHGNEPAGQAAELAERAVAAGPRPVPEPGEPPWFPHAIVALFWTERYGKDRRSSTLPSPRPARRPTGCPGTVLAQRAGSRCGAAISGGGGRCARLARGSPAADSAAPSSAGDRRAGRSACRAGRARRGRTGLEPLRADLQSTSQTAAVLRHARGRLRLAQRRFDEALADFTAAGE